MPAEKTASRPRLTSEERKASIVEAAMKLFAEKGFRGTTTREIAAAVGVSEPVLYEHFKTKRDIYSAIIDCTINAGTPLLEAFRGKHIHSHDDRAFFSELASLLFGWYSKDPTFIRLLLFSNLENHEMRDLFHQRMSGQFFGLIADYIERRVAEGGFRRVDPTIAARGFAGMIANYALTGIVFGCPLPASNEEIIHELVGIYLEGLCTH
jgi:AcrR family transcriptional regulator